MTHANLRDRRPDLLTVRQVARAFKVSEETIRRRCDDGTLHAVRLGSVRRIPASELDRLLGDAP